MIIGKNLKSARLHAGFTLEEAARLTHVHKSTLHRYESDEIKNIPLAKLRLLAGIYRTDLGSLLGFPEPEQESGGFPRRMLAYAERKSLPSEQHILDKYRRLDTHSKHLINLMLDIQFIREKAGLP